MTVFVRSSFSFLTLCLLSASAAAQSVEELAGTWRRVGGEENPKIGVYELQASAGALEGHMLNAPEGFTCDVSLADQGDGKLEGTATWTEAAVDQSIESSWELQVKDDHTLMGRCQWKVWNADGSVADQGWDDYTFEKVTRVGLVVDGEDAEEPFGDPLPEPAQVFGGYRGPGGAWSIRLQLHDWKITPVGDHHPGVSITLQDNRGILTGKATLADGSVSDVELAWDDTAKGFSGRSSWTEGDKTGWAPLKFERLPRVDAGIMGRPAESPKPGEDDIAGVYKREDGLYLRLQGDTSAVTGDLVERDGTVHARVRLDNQGGIWKGTGNFDGTETAWELSLHGDHLSGCSEFVDQLDGQDVVRSRCVREFTRLKRIN